MSSVQRSLVLTHYAPSAEALSLVPDHPIPVPSPSQVLVEVHAAGMNPVDWRLSSGSFVQYMPYAPPIVPGFDLAGIVTAVGDDVKRIKVGDEVYADGWTKSGAYQQYAVVEEKEVSLKPRNMSFIEAASIPLAAETSLGVWNKAGGMEGATVMVIGASGGTGIFALQIAKAMGAKKVIGVTSSRNIDFVQSFGADTVVDYTTTKLSASGLSNIDIIYDCIGGYWEESRSILAADGRFVSIAFWEAAPEPADARYSTYILSTSHTLLDPITAWIEQGKIKTYIEKTFPFTEEGIKQMYQYSEAGKTRGKTILNIKN